MTQGHATQSRGITSRGQVLVSRNTVTSSDFTSRDFDFLGSPRKRTDKPTNNWNQKAPLKKTCSMVYTCFKTSLPLLVDIEVACLAKALPPEGQARCSGGSTALQAYPRCSVNRSSHNHRGVQIQHTPCIGTSKCKSACHRTETTPRSPHP